MDVGGGAWTLVNACPLSRVSLCDNIHGRPKLSARRVWRHWASESDDENLALRPVSQCPTKVHRRARVPDERSQAVGPITTMGPDESGPSRALTCHDYLAVAVLLTNVHAGGGRGSTVMC